MSKTQDADSIWDFPSVPTAEEPPYDPEYDAPVAPAAPAAKPLDLADVLGGTIELSLPGDTFNSRFGAGRITVALGQAHLLPRIVEAVLSDVQKSFDLANAYAAKNAPAGRPSGVAAGGYATQVQVPTGIPQQAPAGQPVYGTGAAAVAGLANGQYSPAGIEAGMMQVQGQYGLLTFPSRQVLSSQDMTHMAQQACAEILGINPANIICFDNRKDLEAGDTRSGHMGVVKFSKVCPEDVSSKFLTRNNRPASVAWVDWDLTRNTVKVSVTKDYKAIEQFIKPLLAG